MDVRGHSGIAKSADQNSVEVAGQHLETVRRNGGAVFEVTVRAPIEVGQVNPRLRSLDYLDRLGNDFLADAIAGNDGNFLTGAHGGKGITDGNLVRAGTQPSATRVRLDSTVPPGLESFSQLSQR